MFQQLFNTTAIWLLSLLAFDLFLRKETYHRYNRIYLLAALLSGIFLPTVSWQPTTVAHSVPLSISMQQVASVRESMEHAVIPVKPVWDLDFFLYLIYGAGVLCNLLFIAREITGLVHLYRTGKRSREGQWIVVETHKSHGPFSIFNCLFVERRSRYDACEWNILLRHEARHLLKRHIIDVILIQWVKIIFWFHPLVYLFRRRILMIHEYQADVAGADEPAKYGNFLVEQAMLQSTPAVTHSFNRSPIKNRIMMLTKKSPEGRRFKTLIALPLVLCCLFYFSNTSYSFKKGNGNERVFKGNTFEFSGKQATENLVRQANGETVTTAVTSFPYPIKMNGDTIYATGSVTKEPVFLGRDKSLTNYLFNGIKDQLAQLEDGRYGIRISYPVVDKKGKLVYYENKGIFLSGAAIEEAVKEKINERLTKLLDDAPKYKPAEINGEMVNWYDAWAMELGYKVEVKDHVPALVYKEPGPFLPE